MRWNIVYYLLSVMFLGACSNSNTDSEDKLFDKPWQIADEIVNSIVIPEFKDNSFLITDFGAINDGITDCSKAIAEAITECNNAGGGRVVVPVGTYLTGAIHLKSNVNLHLLEGAELLFSTDRKKYLPIVHSRFEGMECLNYSPLIYAYKQENIAITGKGKINGQGKNWWRWKGTWSGSVNNGFNGDSKESQLTDNEILTNMVANNTPLEERVFGEGHFLRPSFIQPYLCKNVLIEDIEIVESPMWIIHPVLSENVTIRRVKIESLGPNNDGCDPECCKNVLIKDCYFNTGDDCIAIKSGRNNDGRRIGKACENIVIRNCTMVEGHGGVVMGSEISGNIRNVFAENCIMDSPNLERAIRIKSNSLRGGVVEHIYVRNMEVKQVREAILKINMFYSDEKGANIPIVRNILLDNVNGYQSKYGIWIDAYKEQPVKNILIKNSNFSKVEKDNFINNAENLITQDVVINGEKINK
jgi:polygalacturonase